MRLRPFAFAAKIIFGLFIIASTMVTFAVTTITTNRHAHGANIGWINFQGDTNSGAVIGEYVCSGFVYSANVGWINLGDGTPANLIRYLNTSASDFGVNHDGLGNLRGHAWGANIGWISFEDTGAPRVDLLNGRMSGLIYSANCGWISLSNAFAQVQTGSIQQGVDTDKDGIPDAWEFSHVKSFDDLGTPGDADQDGVSDFDEYLADTDPLDPADHLRITAITHGTKTPSYTTIDWTSQPTRFYAVQSRGTLTDDTFWSDYFVFSFPGAGGLSFDQFADQNFYHIRAFRPLLP